MSESAEDPLERVRAFAARGTSDVDETPATSAGEEGAQDMAKTGAQAAEQTGTEPDGAAEAAVVASNGRGAAGALGAAGAVRPCPVPSGAVIFGELTSAFVDGPRLLRFLGDRRHTGAVVDAGRTAVQVAVLHEGSVVALVAADQGGTRRLERLTLPAAGGQEEHELTVLTYRPEVAIALAQLVNVPERFQRMHGSFVDVPALLTFLKREKANGAVRVTAAQDVGVVLLRGGEVLGAYTRNSPELDDPDGVLKLARQPDAEIDVHVGAITLPPPSVSVGSVV